MSSRQEEKAQRRAEREALEAAAAAKAARAQRLRIAGAAAAAVAVIVVAVILVAGGGGGSKNDAVSASDDPLVAIPAVKETNLAKAIKLANCVQLNPAMEGREHTTGTVTYKNSNPPASGNHNPVWSEDGIYAPGNEPTKEHFVHSLEHGRVEIQYAPTVTKLQREQIETVGSEKLNGTAGYHVLVFQNNTKMPYEVAAVAWTHVLGCKKFNPRVFDAIRAFRKTYTDKGPEIVP